MKLTIVGCSGSMSGPESSASSYLVEATDAAGRTTRILCDLGPGSMGRLLRHCDPADLDAICLSHCHADHMVDMIGMHVYRRWHPQGALPPVTVIGPAETLPRLRGVDGTPETENYATEFTCVRATPGQVMTVGCLRIEAFTALHTVEAYGYRITGPSEEDPEREVVLAFTGDTDLCPSIEDLAQGADLLLSEAAFMEGRDDLRGMHLTGRRAGELAAGVHRGGVGPVGRLVLTHIQPWTDPAIPAANAACAYEGPIDVAVSDAVWTL